MTKYISAFLFTIFFAGNAFAVLFTAEDKAFTMDLPAAWVKVNTAGTIISLKRDNATLQIKMLDNCGDKACIDKEINAALNSIKSKKFKILENAYTGEVIKETEFSTGDPIYSFSFSSAAVDFTTAAFLADGKGYIVNIKGLPYVESDLILSFISPAPKPVNPNAGAAIPTFGDPAVSDISADEHLPVELAPTGKPSTDLSLAPALERSSIKARKIDEAALQAGLQLPQHITAILALLFIFILVFFMALVIRLVLPGDIKGVANPMSGYPVKGFRLYGSPDLFFKIHDNQGNNFIAIASRWGSIFMGFGLITSILFFLLRTVILLIHQQGLISLHPVILNTIVSFAALIIVLGILAFAAGLLVDVLFSYKFMIYDRSGTPTFRCLQKGFNFFKENYLVADSKSAVIFKMQRRRFTLKRTWIISDANEDIAVITEKSALCAFLRLLLGHLAGFLRAQYTIKGRMESTGALASSGRAYTYFVCDLDKPEAIDPQVMAIAGAVIFMRDRDKWFPWVN